MFAKGRGRRGVFLNLKVFQREPDKKNEPVRTVVVIPKKVLPRAVDRNLCRRRIQGIFREPGVSLDGYDVVVFPQKTALDADYRKLAEDVKKCLDESRSSR